MRITYKIFLCSAAVIVGCSGLIIDPSMQAVEAGDYTLAVSACANVPGGGMDICHVRAGTKIESSWKLFLPQKKNQTLGGEVDVYYRDTHYSFGFDKNTKILEIKWSEIMDSDTWSRDMDGEALALVLLRYVDENGIEEVVKFRGIAKIIVTQEGYDRLPIDSGFHTWGSTCKIQYSTAGRGAVSCR